MESVDVTAGQPAIPAIRSTRARSHSRPSQEADVPPQAIASGRTCDNRVQARCMGASSNCARLSLPLSMKRTSTRAKCTLPPGSAETIRAQAGSTTIFEDGVMIASRVDVMGALLLLLVAGVALPAAPWAGVPSSGGAG